MRVCVCAATSRRSHVTKLDEKNDAQKIGASPPPALSWKVRKSVGATLNSGVGTQKKKRKTQDALQASNNNTYYYYHYYY